MSGCATNWYATSVSVGGSGTGTGVGLGQKHVVVGMRDELKGCQAWLGLEAVEYCWNHVRDGIWEEHM